MKSKGNFHPKQSLFSYMHPLKAIAISGSAATLNIPLDIVIAYFLPILSSFLFVLINYYDSLIIIILLRYGDAELGYSICLSHDNGFWGSSTSCWNNVR